MLRPAGCGESPGRRTDKERRGGIVGTGQGRRLIPSRRWRAGCGIDGGKEARPRHRRHSGSSWSAGSTVTRRGIPKRDGTGRGWRLIPSWRWRWPGAGAGRSGSHGMLRRSPCDGPGGPPIRIARWEPYRERGTEKFTFRSQGASVSD
jgi:hypothetical protein